MATIQPTSISQPSFNFGSTIAKIGDKAVSLISSTTNGITAALSSLKSTVMHIISLAIATLKTYTASICHYLGVGFSKLIATAEVIAISISETCGPYYPIIAISIIAFGIGAGYMFAAQNQN